MEDFLELARENTEKDLETCGVLGAFLVRFMFLFILSATEMLSFFLKKKKKTYRI
jgi:STAM-binding protein